MNEEEVVVPEEEQQQQAPKEKKTLSQSTKEIRDKIEETGDTIENFGKAEEKVGQWLKGGSSGTEAATNAGTATSSAVETGSKAVEAASDAAKTASKVQDAAGKTTEAVGKATETAGKIGEGIGKGTQAVGKAEEGVGQGLDTNPYTAAAGKAVKGVSKVTQGVGKGEEVAGKTQQAVGKSQQAAGKGQQAAAKGTEAAADASKQAAKGTEAAAKTTKAANEAAKKGNDGSKSLADKLEEGGKKHQKLGRDIKKFAGEIDSDKVIDNLFDKIGKGGKGLGKFLKGVVKLFDPETIATIVTILLILLTIGTMLVAYILSPMFYMDLIRKTAADPDKIEKVTNFVNGLGFSNSEEAFYKEVDYLNDRYSDEIDVSYIMAALYYTDIYYTTDETYLIEDDSESICDLIPFKSDDKKATCDEIQIGARLAKYFVKSYMKEATTTTDDVGLVYSANKIYRLRELAKHQFLGDKQLKHASLDVYLEMCVKKLGNEFSNMLQYAPLLLAYAIAHANPTTGALFDQAILNIEGGILFFDLLEVVNGTETWSSLMLNIRNGKGNEIIYDFRNLMETIYNCLFQIDHVELDINLDDYLSASSITSLLFPGVNFEDPDAIIKEILLPGYGVTIGQLESALKGDLPSSLDKVLEKSKKLVSSVEIYYYDYKYDNKGYEEYLVNYYIPNMPEFSTLIKGENGKKDEKKIKQIAADIYQTKTLFDNMYQSEESAKENNKCVGDINLDLLAELEAPVDLTIGQTVKFPADMNYGVYKGYMHNGVDLNEDTTGTKEGDNVYALYDGVVMTSTADGSFKDENVRGGWVSIQYKVQYVDSDILDGVISNQFKNKISTIIVYYGGLNSNTLTLKQGTVVSAGEVIGTVGTAEMSETGKKASLHFGVYDDKTDRFINPVNMFITCKALNSASGLSVHNIAISKSNFIAATQKYINSNGGALSSWDLEKTYEVSKANDVNPELVVIRAIKEGFSPGASKNNYWGIGCYNSGGSCTSYSSFEDGIAGFARVVKKYDTIEDMMSEYAYIGDYWYNPGSWSLGGCKYFPYIKKYMSDSRINTVATYCDSSESCTRDGGDCHKTNDEDQKAYAQYNCEGMNALYESIYAEYHKK